jgi:hypothetical protein
VRYLRIFTNSALGGAFGAAFMGVLVLQLNPHLPLDAAVRLKLFRVCVLFYGTHLTVAFYVVIVLRQLFSREVLSPGWVSVRLLAWISPVVCWAAALLMWFNLDGYASVLAASDVRRMTAGAVATAICGALLLALAFVHAAFARRGSRLAASLLGVGLVASLVLPLVARGTGRPAGAVPGPAAEPPGSRGLLPVSPGASIRHGSGRVFLVLLDGASLEYIQPATAGGALPNFGRMLDTGASMHLQTLRPTQAVPVWAAAMTGRLPTESGVRSAASYSFGAEPHRIDLLPDLSFSHALARLGFLEEHLQQATSLRVKPLWQIASEAGVRVGVAGVPLTDPAPRLDGYVVSDRLQLARLPDLALEDQELVSPAAAGDMARRAAGPAPPGPRIGTGGEVPAIAPTPRDAWYSSVSKELDRQFDPRLSIVRYVGIDVAGHYFLKFVQPQAFGDVSEEERRRYGRALEWQYAWVDDRLGELMARLEPADLLVVASGFGMEPVTPGKRLLARLLGQADLTGTHERAPDGFLMAWGEAVARERRPMGSIVDLTPTLLYLLGLPVGRDMDGVARADLLRSEYTADTPITFIPSYR